MAIYRKVLVPCTIERGGFGNERTFTIEKSVGGSHVGIAPWIYCYNKEKIRVKDEPKVGETISGFVEGKKITKGDGNVKVAFPDGSICIINAGELSEPPTELSRNVPIES